MKKKQGPLKDYTKLNKVSEYHECYQVFTNSTSIHKLVDSVPRNLSYLYCGVVEEFCEFKVAVKTLHQVMKEETKEEELEKKGDVSSEEESPKVAAQRLGVLKELGDVTWYLTSMCNELKVDLESVVQFSEELEEDKTIQLNSAYSDQLSDLMDQVLSNLGTIGGKIKKSIRDDNEIVTNEKKKVIVQCIREVFQVLSEEFCPRFRSSLREVMRLNTAKAASRFARGVVQGDGDNR